MGTSPQGDSIGCTVNVCNKAPQMLANIQKPRNIKDTDYQIYKTCTVRHAIPGHIHSGWALLLTGIVRAFYGNLKVEQRRVYLISAEFHRAVGSTASPDSVRKLCIRWQRVMYWFQLPRLLPMVTRVKESPTTTSHSSARVMSVLKS